MHWDSILGWDVCFDLRAQKVKKLLSFGARGQNQRVLKDKLLLSSPPEPPHAVSVPGALSPDP
jgi:hypothetical protein